MMRIYPSLLETKVEELRASILDLKDDFSYLQIDVADGILVPHTTVGIKAMQELFLQEKNTLRNVELEFHLMVLDYPMYVKKLEEIKSIIAIKRILVHAAAYKKFERKTPNFEFGIVLSPQDSVKDYQKIILAADALQIMTVDPGLQGNPFLVECLDKIAQARKIGFKKEIIVDGGINDKTLRIILKQRRLPDSVCPGSYLKENTQVHLQTLQKMIKKS